MISTHVQSESTFEDAVVDIENDEDIPNYGDNCG